MDLSHLVEQVQKIQKEDVFVQMVKDTAINVVTEACKLKE
jgi:hypothetical protein